MDRCSCCCVLTSLCQLSLLLGTCSAASISPLGPPAAPLRRSRADVLASVAVAVLALFVLRRLPALPCPHLQPYLLLGFQEAPRACTPWILAPPAFLFSARLSLLSLWLPMMDY
ncbi:hypothetical protein PVAP13_2NG334500 [Panicum virgatum]|uniref:Secreted protein n=1 Tax=Panicum virgatum TaxID=38727 RepID=A0A8T0VJS5_PANVG|nr:hypothetical protein PVAP13_2NG334500 [Panicum virgatum]